jgi:hypothetical protein
LRRTLAASGTVKFDGAQLKGLPGAEYSVFMVDKTAHEIATSLRLKFASSIDSMDDIYSIGGHCQGYDEHPPRERCWPTGPQHWDCLVPNGHPQGRWRLRYIDEDHGECQGRAGWQKVKLSGTKL